MVYSLKLENQIKLILKLLLIYEIDDMTKKWAIDEKNELLTKYLKKLIFIYHCYFTIN